ncbi:hypothetical protein T10_5396 [Trichinella papuae]|uniref:Uncharacterized protein n=1 Tax=Trichinella papuae TaxID=268474 RepID=A0A0V1MVD5_9BILA|nr:hypothetical protein T10_5396 [Trichinella papuae]
MSERSLSEKSVLNDLQFSGDLAEAAALFQLVIKQFTGATLSDSLSEAQTSSRPSPGGPSARACKIDKDRRKRNGKKDAGYVPQMVPSTTARDLCRPLRLYGMLSKTKRTKAAAWPPPFTTNFVGQAPSMPLANQH